jgi:hypothetical protein
MPCWKQTSSPLQSPPALSFQWNTRLLSSSEVTMCGEDSVAHVAKGGSAMR